MPKTLGQVAYEEDCRRRPYYDNGQRRAPWETLCQAVQWSWERNPTARDWSVQPEHRAPFT